MTVAIVFVVNTVNVMTDKITAGKLAKKYLRPADRPQVTPASTRDLRDLIPQIHENVNTPTAAQLMHPEVGVGEGCIRDKVPYMTTDDLPQNWMEIMSEAAAQGKGPVSLMLALNITKAGFETLLETSPEFQQAYERCLLLSCEWWEDRGRDMSVGAKGNSTVWIANMVNRWGWNSDKSVQASTVHSTVDSNVKATVRQALTEDELDAEIKRRGLDKFIELNGDGNHD